MSDIPHFLLNLGIFCTFAAFDQTDPILHLNDQFLYLPAKLFRFATRKNTKAVNDKSYACMGRAPNTGEQFSLQKVNIKAV